VQNIVLLIDDDGSGQVEFAEFLQIIKLGGAKSKQ
jgi:Ca2+-binding EF-hand superfamily protein